MKDAKSWRLRKLRKRRKILQRIARTKSEEVNGPVAKLCAIRKTWLLVTKDAK
jgi:hypothetical protein